MVAVVAGVVVVGDGSGEVVMRWRLFVVWMLFWRCEGKTYQCQKIRGRSLYISFSDPAQPTQQVNTLTPYTRHGSRVMRLHQSYPPSAITKLPSRQTCSALPISNLPAAYSSLSHKKNKNPESWNGVRWQDPTLSHPRGLEDPGCIRQDNKTLCWTRCSRALLPGSRTPR